MEVWCQYPPTLGGNWGIRQLEEVLHPSRRTPRDKSHWPNQRVSTLGYPPSPARNQRLGKCIDEWPATSCRNRVAGHLFVHAEWTLVISVDARIPNFFWASPSKLCLPRAPSWGITMVNWKVLQGGLMKDHETNIFWTRTTFFPNTPTCPNVTITSENVGSVPAKAHWRRSMKKWTGIMIPWPHCWHGWEAQRSLGISSLH